MRNSPVATAVLSILVAAGAASSQTSQTKQCLHGANESRADRTRREKAVELAHDINSGQSVARRLRFRSDGGYVPLDQLRNLRATPEGFRVQFHTDGTSYSFSIKDTMDPCLYSVFSDQTGDVYEATASPLTPRTKLLTGR
jgi:hypothetical protein